MAKRNLYLNTIPVEEAVEKYLASLGDFQRKTEVLPVINALDRVTSQAVYARYSSPLYDSAAMDGIAVISSKTEGARENNPLTIRQGEDYVVVDTGDPVHPPYDAVIMAEDLEADGDDAVKIRASAASWQHLRPVGEDIVQGEMILPGKHKIRPVDMGVLLSGGITELEVFKKPTAAIFPTGSEIIEPEATPKDGDIIESNSRMFEALALKLGAEPTRFPPIPDDYDKIKEAISDAAESFDIVIINAGSSAGTEDYTVHVLRELGEVIVHGVAIKPGKPTILAKIKGKPVIGLPGYPVSAYISFESFVTPVINLLTGADSEESPVVKATVTRRIVSSLKHKEYVRVKVGRVGDRLVATPLSRGAGAAMSLVRADGFCIIDRDSEGTEAGEEINVSLIRSPSELNKTLVVIGSHDIILDELGNIMPGDFGMYISSTHVGSMGGLMALRNGEAHIAPCHLLDEETGEYNTAIVKKLFPNTPMAIIKGVGRTQGILVKKGNPLGIKSIQDLSSPCRYVNRQRGAGTRVLFDYKLKAAGLTPDSIDGYDREAATHMAVAAAVKGESADAGMGIYACAKAMELDFIPIGDEEYDFILPQTFLNLPVVDSFIKTLQSEQFIRRLEDLGGYSWENLGKIQEV